MRARDYRAIWNDERDESPLKTITRAQAEKLAAWVGDGGLGPASSRVKIAWGMRYGNPSIKAGIAELQAAGCDRLLLVPLYPQYAAATSATVCDKAFEALTAMRRQPILRVAAALLCRARLYRRAGEEPHRARSRRSISSLR